MKVGARTLVAVASYAGVVALFWTVDLGDKGLVLEAEPTPRAAETAEEAEISDAADTGSEYNLKQLRLLNRTIGYIRNNYVDPERIDVRKMLAGALSQVELTVPEVLVQFDALPETSAGAAISVGAAKQRFDYGKLTDADLYELAWALKDIAAFLDAELPRSVPRDEVELALVNGMLETLDPHSVLLSADVFDDMQVGTTGKFGGLGIVISSRKGELTVVSVMEGTPASRAGVKTGDTVSQINDESTVNMSLDEAVNRLRGEVDTPVTIWLRRKSWSEPKPFTITREEIKIESVASHDLGHGVGYVRIKNFQQTTFEDLSAAIEALSRKGSAKKGLVLDMRENPGGLLDQAIDVSDLFLESGTIVATVGHDGRRIREEKKARKADTIADLPIIVLVNSGSASASEIVTGALKNNDRAAVLGNQTFGKGSVQVLYEMVDQQGREAALKLTVAQYLTPGDQSIQSVGIAPDILAYPVHLEPAELDLYVSEKDLVGEAELDNHLASERDDERAKSIASAELLRYYEPPAPDAKGPGGSEEAAADGEPSDEEAEDAAGYGEVQEDYLMRLARDLLLAAGRPTRRATLEAARHFLDREKAKQEAAIHDRLESLGVHWPDGTARPEPGARVEVSLRTDLPGNTVKAGGTITVTAEAKNVGQVPVQRLRAVTTCDNDWFDNRELVFGTLAPGEAHSWSFQVEMSKSAVARRDPIHLALYDDDVAIPGGTAPLSVGVTELPRPHFAFAWAVDDSQKGNGDGLLQRGEEATLRVHLGNHGEGTIGKIQANLKNESGRGVFLSRGQVTLDDGLAPGATATLEYTFKVQDYLDGDTAKLTLAVLDTALRAQDAFPLRLPVIDAPRTDDEVAEAAGWYGVERSVELRSGASTSSDVIGVAARPGALKVTARRGHWLRVEGPQGLPGWIKEDDTSGPVRIASRETVPPEPATLDIVWTGQPPRIELGAGTLDALETSAATAKLSGTAVFGSQGPKGRDVYVFRNDEKVYYVAAEDKAASSLDFAADIPLVDGENAIHVYARQGRDSVEHRLFYVHKN